MCCRSFCRSCVRAIRRSTCIFARRRPTMCLRISAGGRLDVVLLALPIDEPEIETLALFDDAFVLAMPAGKAPSHKMRATPELFENEHLLLLEEGHCLRDQALSFCSLKQVKSPRYVRYNESLHVGADGRQRFRRNVAAEDEPRNRSQARGYRASRFRCPGTHAQDRARVAQILATPGGISQSSALWSPHLAMNLGASNISAIDAAIS